MIGQVKIMLLSGERHKIACTREHGVSSSSECLTGLNRRDDCKIIARLTSDQGGDRSSYGCKRHRGPLMMDRESLYFASAQSEGSNRQLEQWPLLLMIYGCYLNASRFMLSHSKQLARLLCIRVLARATLSELLAQLIFQP